MAHAIISGLLLGLISSFHCVGMCGPLALALPVQHLSRLRKSLALLLYHAGRISVYAGLGLLFGIAGRRIYIAGFQQWLSIALGGLILFLLMQYFIYKNPLQPAWLKKWYQKIQQLALRFWRSPSQSGFLLLGMINGLLPCAMVYLALAGALSSSEVKNAVLFMMMFGLGTFPALLALHYFGFRIGLSVRNGIKKWMPVVMATMALMLILRGLNLGIPFISPVLAHAPGKPVFCH